MGYEPVWMKALRKLPGGPRVIAKYQRPKVEGAGLRLEDYVSETEAGYFRLDKPIRGAYVKCIAAPRKDHFWGAASDCCLHCGVSVKTMSEADSRGLLCQPVTWWYCDPNGHWGFLRESVVTEHEDMTITVEGLNVNGGLFPDPWSGTLVRGVWKASA